MVICMALYIVFYYIALDSLIIQFTNTFFIGKYAELLIDIITHSLYVSKTLFGFLF